MAAGPGTIPRARGIWRRAATHPDGVTLVGLVVFAICLVGIPAVHGSLVLPGDDLFQNEPLRALTGSIIRSGRLPAWDPLIWSGTPLLAGWNAGSMFPGTWLFAIVPAGLAWTANLALAYAMSSTGVYLLGRSLRIRTPAALLAALVFTYTGFMNGQIVHIGLIQGTAFLPWTLLAIEHATGARTRSERAGAVALLGGSSALTVLAGDPRAVSSAAIVAAIWIAARIIVGAARSVSFVVLTVGGGALGIALSAIQWIPGIGFLHSSQRAASAYSFFSAGSLDLRTLSTNLLAPFLIGGNGNFGLPIYVGSYNLPEVTIGAGLVALVAAGAYLPSVIDDARRWYTTRRYRDGHRLGSAYALIVVGIVLSMGGDTPLGHLLVHLPLYSGERLQNRNAVIFDLGLALLVGYFVDDLYSRQPRANGNGARAEGSPPEPLGVLGSPLRQVLGSIAPLATIALVAIAYVDPLGLEHRLGVSGPRPALFTGLDRYLIPTIVVAGALVAFVGMLRFVPRRFRGHLAMLFVLCDLALYLTGMGLITVPTSALATTTAESSAIARLAGPGGRSALLNSSFEDISSDPLAPEKFGVTDLNLLHNLPSVQGYGSIVNSAYENATETHLFEDIDVGALDSSTFDELNLTTLLTLPAYLEDRIPVRSGIPVALGNGAFVTGPNVPAPPAQASGPYPITTSESATFLLSHPYAIDHVSVIMNNGSGSPTAITVSADDTNGHSVTRTAVRKGASFTVGFPHGTTAVRFEVRVLRGLPGEIGAFVVVTDHPGERLILDGRLENALTAPHWTYAGTIGALTAFTNHQARGGAWLKPLAGHASTDGGSVVVLSRSDSAPTVMRVDSPQGAILVRSEEYAHGWTARLHPQGGGPTIVLPVEPDGLIEQVTIPKGTYTVTWRYAPTGILVGLVSSGAGALVLFALIVVSLRRRLGMGSREV
jgi:hypothetical protein